MYVDGAQDAAADLDWHAEFGARVRLFFESQNSPGFLFNIVCEQGLARVYDVPDDAYSERLTVAFGEVGLVGPRLGVHGEVAVFQEEKGGVVILEVSSYSSNDTIENFIRVQGGKHKTRDLVDDGKVCGSFPLPIQEPCDLFVVAPEFGLRFDLFTDVGHDCKGADVPVVVVAQRSAGYADGHSVTIFVNHEGLIRR